MIEIDNKKMWESILSFKCEVKIEDVENNPAGIAVKCIGDSIKHALKDQGLKYENGEIVCIETEPECHCTGIGSKKAEGKLSEMLDNIDEESLEETREKMKQDSEELTEFKLCLQIIIGSFCKKDATKEYIKGSARELLSIARQQIAYEIDIDAIWGRLVFRGVERLSREDVEEFVEKIKKGK